MRIHNLRDGFMFQPVAQKRKCALKNPYFPREVARNYELLVVKQNCAGL